MNAINNINVVDKLCGGCGCAAFATVVSYAVGATSVVFTQSSTYDAGDSLKRLRVNVYDKNGKQASAIMSGAGSGATAGTATVGAGALLTVPVSAGGTGYTVPPRVKVTGGSGTGAIARAILTAGVVTSVVVENAGTGYATAPTVTFVTTEAEVSLIGMDVNGISFKATLISTGGCKADLGLSNVYPITNTSGNLGNINEQGDNNEAGNN